MLSNRIRAIWMLVHSHCCLMQSYKTTHFRASNLHIKIFKYLETPRMYRSQLSGTPATKSYTHTTDHTIGHTSVKWHYTVLRQYFSKTDELFKLLKTTRTTNFTSPSPKLTGRPQIQREQLKTTLIAEIRIELIRTLSILRRYIKSALL